MNDLEYMTIFYYDPHYFHYDPDLFFKLMNNIVYGKTIKKRVLK